MIEEIDEAPAAYEPTRLGGIALALWSSLGLLAAFILSVDKLKMLEDPNFVPSCNFNPVLSCGSVITTDEASAFGFPNPFLGLAGFAVIATLGVLLAARVTLPRWVLAGAAAGSLVGFAFVHWLAYQSLYTIGALCPWCMVVWAISPLIWLWTTSWVAASSPRSSVRSIGRALWDWRYLAVASWYLLVVVLILIRFWSYWRTLL